MPARIASLLASATEALYLIGADDAVAGISHECDFPERALTKPRLTRSLIDSDAPSAAIDREVQQRIADDLPLYEIDAPLLSGLNPTLIVTQAQCDVCAVKLDDVLQLVRDTPALKGCEVLALNPMTLSDILDDVCRIGHAAGYASGANRAVDQLRSRIDGVSQRLHNVDRPRVACVEWSDPLMVAANWMPDLVEAAGGRHDLTVSGKHSVVTPWESVLTYDPEVLVVSPCGFDLARCCEDAMHMTSLPGWNDVTAVKQNQVFALDGNAYLNRSGPRIVDTIEILAHLIHPRQFSAPAHTADVAFRKIRPQSTRS